jgi:hypothetical protein
MPHTVASAAADANDVSVSQGRSHWYGKGGSYLTTFQPYLFLIDWKRLVLSGIPWVHRQLRQLQWRRAHHNSRWKSRGRSWTSWLFLAATVHNGRGLVKVGVASNFYISSTLRLGIWWLQSCIGSLPRLWTLRQRQQPNTLVDMVASHHRFNREDTVSLFHGTSVEHNWAWPS